MAEVAYAEDGNVGQPSSTQEDVFALCEEPEEFVLRQEVAEAKHRIQVLAGSLDTVAKRAEKERA
jgi:hypothetical protein